MDESYHNINSADQVKEAKIIELARAGDTIAFRNIVKKHQGHLLGTIKGMLGNVVEVDDVGQEVFIRFFKNIEQFEGKSSLKTYLTRIAINLSLNELQRRKRQYKYFEKGESAKFKVEHKMVSDEEQNDVRQLINKALEYLDPKFRTVLVLRTIQGYSTKETAKILDIPLGTVLSRLNAAQKKLKEVVLELNPDYLKA